MAWNGGKLISVLKAITESGTIATPPGSSTPQVSRCPVLQEKRDQKCLDRDRDHRENHLGGRILELIPIACIVRLRVAALDYHSPGKPRSEASNERAYSPSSDNFPATTTAILCSHHWDLDGGFGQLRPRFLPIRDTR
jgi:hypothetical protein